MATIEWFEPQQRVILEARGDGLPPNPKRFTVGHDGVESITHEAGTVVVKRKDGSSLTYLTQGVVMSKPTQERLQPRKR